MRLVLANAALAALLVAMYGSAGAPAAPRADTRSSAAPAPPLAATAAPYVPTPAPPRGNPAHTAAAAVLHAVETSVQAARLRGAGANEIHQLRASRLTAAQMEALLAMESAKEHWGRQVLDLRARCGNGEACSARLTPEEQARWRSYAAPALRQ